MKFKQILALALVLLMLIGGLPAAGVAAGANAPQDYVQALAQLVATHWCDNFVAPVVMEAGATDITVQWAQARGLHVETIDGTTVVTAPYQTRRLLVGTDTGVLGNTHGAIAVVPLSGNRFALQYETEEQARRARVALEVTPGVRYAEPDGVMAPHAEISAQSQPILGWGTERIGAPAFRAMLPANAPTVTVAVLDTGMDITHPFFSGRVSPHRWNFVGGNNNVLDLDGHGTHIAGIVADASAPNVQIMPLRVFGDDRLGVESLIVEALRFAVRNGAQVANMSFGGAVAASNSWAEAIQYAQGRGMHLVASVGNDGVVQRSFPAAMPGIIAVSSSTRTNTIAAHSNRGSWVDIGAPGMEIRSTLPGGGTGYANGTSMAAAYVSAAAALLLLHSTITRENMLPTLTSLSDPWNHSGDTSQLGAGILNITPRGAGESLPNQLTLAPGQTTPLRPAQSPPAPESFSFASSNPNVVAVSPGGGVVALRPGAATITVQGPGGNVAVPVTVTGTGPAGSFNSISLLSPPAQTSFVVGERFNTAGGRLRLHFSDGSSFDINLLPEHVSGFNPQQAGTQTLTVNLSGRTTTFIVTVNARATNVSIAGLPDRLIYREHEHVDLTGGSVRVTNPNGTSEVLPMNHPRVLATAFSGGAPGATGFDRVRVVVDGFASADFWVVHVNANGRLDGMTGSLALSWQENTVLPTVASPYVRWHSSNPAVLTVNANGTINYVGRGTTTLTLVFEPPGHATTVVGYIQATVSFSLWQWILWIFAFGWLWM